MKTIIEPVLVSHDYGHEVYDVTMPARDIHQMYKHGLLIVDPEHQRGRNTVTGREVFKKEKVERWANQLLADKAVFGQLNWNFRPEATKAYYHREKGQFIIEFGSATLPDSAHRHRSIFLAVDSVARGSDFDLEMPFSVRIWCVPESEENDIFYGMNQEGDKADATRSKWLAQRNVGQKIASAVVRSSPYLTEANVETVTNTLSVKNPRLAGFNTFSVAFEEGWRDVPDDDVVQVVGWFVRFWDRLVAVRAELKRLPLPERQKTRRASIGVSALAIHGYVHLGRRFYTESLELDLLDALADDEYFALTNPAWQERGLVVPSINRAGVTVLQVRNSHQTRRAMAAALMEKVGLTPAPPLAEGTDDPSAVTNLKASEYKEHGVTADTMPEGPPVSQWLTAVTDVLQHEGGPLHYRELHKRLRALGGPSFRGQNPLASFLAAISSEAGKENSALVRIGHGEYTLRAHEGNGKAGTENPRRKGSRGTGRAT